MKKGIIRQIKIKRKNFGFKSTNNKKQNLKLINRRKDLKNLSKIEQHQIEIFILKCNNFSKKAWVSMLKNQMMLERGDLSWVLSLRIPRSFLTSKEIAA